MNADTSDIFTTDVHLSDADGALIRLYEDLGTSVDRLAYTEQFEVLFTRYREAGHAGDRAEVFRRLLMLRKAGWLPRLFKTATT